MRQFSRVVWSEGMHLGPHHFQAQSNYFEDVIQFTVDSLWLEPYGFAGWEMDAEALRNGIVSLRHARGMFADGLAFRMPEADPLPAPRDIAPVFPASRDKMVVSLAVPQYRFGAANCGSPDTANGHGRRYRAEDRVVRDETNGLDERPIAMGRKNIRLITDTESAEGSATLPVARVLRDGSGGFVYDASFIPPCLLMQASRRLMTIAHSLVEILDAKRETLAPAVGRAGTAGGYSSQQVASFWFLHAINSALAPLRHLVTAQTAHPAQLYEEMLRLGGALCTFGLDSKPGELPLYDHRNLEACFGELETHIRHHLEIMLPTRCIRIHLEPGSKYFYEADIKDKRCLGASRWVLGVKAKVGEVELIRNTPQLVKVCSKTFVGELVRRAVPGLTLTHLPQVPPEIPASVECQYFSINKYGPCWEHMMQTKTVGVYVPGELPFPDVELFVILES